MKTNILILAGLLALFVGCGTIQPKEVVYPTPEGGTITNLEYNVSSNVLATIKAADEAQKLVPNPATPFVSIGLGLLATVLGAVAKVKTSLANQHKSDLQRVAVAVETLPPAVASQVKAQIASVAGGAGSTLDRTIQEVLP